MERSLERSILKGEIEKPRWFPLIEKYIKDNYKINLENLWNYKKIRVGKGLNSISDLLKKLDEKLEKTKGNIVFRGEDSTRHDHPCTSVVFRKKKYSDKELQNRIGEEVEGWVNDTIKLAESFSIIKNNIWEVFTESRMVGMDSIFGDFTRNFLVALFFACTENREEDGVVYLLNVDRLEDFDINDKKDKNINIKELLTFNKDERFGKHLKTPHGINNTSFAQDSYLIIWKNPKPQISFFEKISISTNEKNDIRIALESLFNLSYSRLHPGFEGFRETHNKTIYHEKNGRSNNIKYLLHLGKGDNVQETDKETSILIEKEKYVMKKVNRGIIEFLIIEEEKAKYNKQENDDKYWREVLVNLIMDTNMLNLDPSTKEQLNNTWNMLFNFWKIDWETSHSFSLFHDIFMSVMRCVNWKFIKDSNFHLENMILLFRYFIYKSSTGKSKNFFYLLSDLLLFLLYRNQKASLDLWKQEEEDYRKIIISYKNMRENKNYILTKDIRNQIHILIILAKPLNEKERKKVTKCLNDILTISSSDGF